MADLTTTLCSQCGANPAMGGDPPAVYTICERCWRDAVGTPEAGRHAPRHPKFHRAAKEQEAS